MIQESVDPPRLYKTALPLSYIRWKYLHELKATIPPYYHQFDDNLPWKSK